MAMKEISKGTCIWFSTDSSPMDTSLTKNQGRFWEEKAQDMKECMSEQ